MGQHGHTALPRNQPYLCACSIETIAAQSDFLMAERNFQISQRFSVTFIQQKLGRSEHFALTGYICTFKHMNPLSSNHIISEPTLSFLSSNCDVCTYLL